MLSSCVPHARQRLAILLGLGPTNCIYSFYGLADTNVIARLGTWGATVTVIVLGAFLVYYLK